MRRRILAATFVVLARDGRRKLQLSDVAAEAKVSRPTLDRYFGSKEGLLEAFGLYEQDNFDSGIVAAMAGLSGADRLDAALRFIVEFQSTYSLGSLADIEPEHVLNQMKRVLPIMHERIPASFPATRTRSRPRRSSVSLCATIWFAPAVPISLSPNCATPGARDVSTAHETRPGRLACQPGGDLFWNQPLFRDAGNGFTTPRISTSEPGPTSGTARAYCTRTASGRDVSSMSPRVRSAAAVTSLAYYLQTTVRTHQWLYMWRCVCRFDRLPGFDLHWCSPWFGWAAAFSARRNCCAASARATTSSPERRSSPHGRSPPSGINNPSRTVKEAFGYHV
jgi:AcrR family transcriptional regulator